MYIHKVKKMIFRVYILINSTRYINTVLNILYHFCLKQDTSILCILIAFPLYIFVIFFLQKFTSCMARAGVGWAENLHIRRWMMIIQLDFLAGITNHSILFIFHILFQVDGILSYRSIKIDCPEIYITNVQYKVTK
jgi:hypothetical protein